MQLHLSRGYPDISGGESLVISHALRGSGVTLKRFSWYIHIAIHVRSVPAPCRNQLIEIYPIIEVTHI